MAGVRVVLLSPGIDSRQSSKLGDVGLSAYGELCGEVTGEPIGELW